MDFFEQKGMAMNEEIQSELSTNDWICPDTDTMYVSNDPLNYDFG